MADSQEGAASQEVCLEDSDQDGHTTHGDLGPDRSPQASVPLLGAVDSEVAEASSGVSHARPASGRVRHSAPRAHRRRESPPPPPPPPEFGDNDVPSQPEARLPAPLTEADEAQSANHLRSSPAGNPNSQIPSSPGGSASKDDQPPGRIGVDGGRDCAICLQPCIHPVQLPCQHVFCFLCAKGAIKNSRRCAMCRSEVPADYLDNPLLLDTERLQEEMQLSDGYQWFYEGRNGWWKYDERTAADLETAFSGGEKRAELLVAGYRYVVDFETMLQLRRSDPARRRRVKRDLASAAKKGVAGLRVEGAGAAEGETGLEAALQAVTVAAPDDAPPPPPPATGTADGDGETQL